MTTMANRHADQFCDLSGFDPNSARPVLFAHDGSDITLIEIKGARSIISENDYADRMIDTFAAEMAQVMKAPGHNIVVSFESSYNAEAEVDGHLERQRHNAELKQLRVAGILDETRNVILRRAVSERLIVALISRPQAGQQREIMAQKKANDQARSELPAMRAAMDPYAELPGLEGPHMAFVQSFMSALSRVGIIASVVTPGEDGSRPDIAKIRQGIFFHETPNDWKPHEPGAVKYPPIKTSFDSDVSDFFAPPLAMQVLSSAPVVSQDMRRITWGPRSFAVCQVLRYPKNLRPFNHLVERLRAAQMPYRVAISLESLNNGDKTSIRIRQVAAQLLGIFDGTTKLLGKNLQLVTDALGSDTEAVVKTNLSAATWIEPGEPEEKLRSRASALLVGLQSWGDCTVTDSPASPVRTLAETVAGMNATTQSWRGTLAPVSDLSLVLPFHRTAPVFETGDSLFTSVEGKLTPHRAFAPELPAWLTLVSAGTGSGKSVLMNRMNFDLAAYRPGSELPFMMVADVGVSSSGCMNLLSALLPEERRREVIYMRPKNTAEYAVNLFDISPGSRHPLDREKVFQKNFLLTAIPMDHELLPQLMTRVIDRVYEIKSDLSVDSNANRWQVNIDPQLNEAAKAAGIKLTDRTRYWTLVDEFMLRGNYEMAIRAQRYAVPRIKDIATVIAEPQIKDDFGEDMIRNVQRHLEALESSYPMFTNYTSIETGSARIMAIDLQDVLTVSSMTDEAARKNTLMFLMTRQVFMSKIAGDKDDIRAMSFPDDPEIRQAYERYWLQTFQTIAETPKRMVMDEYHLTGTIDTINDVVWHDCRTGRKWNLEVALVSQELADFKGLTSQATTIMILNSDSQAARKAILEELGGNPAVDKALQRYVNGPDKSDPSKGANVLAMYKLRNDEKRWVIFNNALGIRLLWALSTKSEDRAVRDELYSRVPLDRALDLLAKRFPEGTAIGRWEEVSRQQRRSAGTSIAKLVADEIMQYEMSNLMKVAAE